MNNTIRLYIIHYITKWTQEVPGDSEESDDEEAESSGGDASLEENDDDDDDADGDDDDYNDDDDDDDNNGSRIFKQKGRHYYGNDLASLLCCQAEIGMCYRS